MWRKTRQPSSTKKRCIGTDGNRNFGYHHAGKYLKWNLWFCEYYLLILLLKCWNSLIFSIFRGWSFKWSMLRNFCRTKAIFRTRNVGIGRICQNTQSTILHCIPFVQSTNSLSIRKQIIKYFELNEKFIYERFVGRFSYQKWHFRFFSKNKRSRSLIHMVRSLIAYCALSSRFCTKMTSGQLPDFFKHYSNFSGIHHKTCTKLWWFGELLTLNWRTIWTNEEKT